MDRLYKLPGTSLALSLIFCFFLTADAGFAKSERGKGHVLPSDANYNVGISKYKAKDYDGAVDAFKQSIYFARNEYMPQAWYWLGVTYMVKGGEDSKAIEAFNKHLEQNVGPSWEAHIHLGHIYLRLNRLSEAEDEARKALADYQGQCPKAYNLYGLVSKARNDYDGAVGWFLQALGDKPWSYTEAWMNYADMLMWAKRWPSAIQQFTGMINSEKTLKGLDEETLFTSRGKCLLALGDHQNALEDFHRTLSINKDNSEAHLNLGMMFDQERHISSAIKEYKEFCRTCPEQKRTSAVQQRIAMLEQMLGPSQAAPQAPQPSPYMRKQQMEGEKEQQMQDHTPGDSGF
ncbi:MAG: tetratricopeptide repeat protein [Candidatus Melainabacteria bacterium]|nr:tetratricopeptide repeat protein [Candidatus Melainabacteria bacterium]